MKNYHPSKNEQPPLYIYNLSNIYCSPLIFNLTTITSTKWPQWGFRTFEIVAPWDDLNIMTTQFIISYLKMVVNPKTDILTTILAT